MEDHVRQTRNPGNVGYDAFGPHRMFWGTDISKMPCSWKQSVTMFTEELGWLKGRDLDLAMGEALCAWWGWNRAA